MNYKDVSSIAKSVRTMAALKQAQSIDPADTRKLAEAYANLARLEPENAEHQSKAVRYASEWKEGERHPPCSLLGCEVGASPAEGN